MTGEDALGASDLHPRWIQQADLHGLDDHRAKVMASAAEGLRRLTLELGGNDAGIVLDDCDPSAIAKDLFWGAFINGGQTCAAIKRLYVHRKLYGPVCEALCAYAATVPMGEGLSERTLLGPVQNSRQRAHVAALVDDAYARGDKILCGGKIPDGPGYFYPITLVSDVNPGARLVVEEQFGPALPILPFDDLGAAVAMANNTPFGLGGSVWSVDAKRAKARSATPRVRFGLD